MAYATVTDLQAVWPSGEQLPADAARLLDAASDLLDTTVLLTAVYDVDDVSGLPTDPVVTAALRDATCAQVRWWDETGDELGTAGLAGSVSIGSVSISASAAAGAAGSGETLAPQVGRILRRPKLAGRLRLGVIGSC